MKLGVVLPTRDRVLAGRPEVEPLLALAELGERVGLDSVWVGDGPLARPRHDALTTLAAVAARTSSIAVGTSVLLAPIRHPMLVLHQAASVDLISEGRLVLGLGSGFPMPPTQAEFEALGADYPGRHARLEDTVRLAHHVWRGHGKGEFRGQTLVVESPGVLPAPHRAGGPPVWLPGAGPAPLRRVGQLADGWLPYPPTPEQYAADLEVVRHHADDAGRPSPTAALLATIAVDADHRLARRLADRHLERYYGVGADVVGQVQAVFAGTHGAAIDWLRAYRDAGAEHVVVRVAREVDAEVVRWLAATRDALGPSGETSAVDPAGDVGVPA